MSLLYRLAVTLTWQVRASGGSCVCGLDHGIQMTARVLSNVWAGQQVRSQAKQEVGRALRADSSLGCGWGSFPEQEVSTKSILAHSPGKGVPEPSGPRNGLCQHRVNDPKMPGQQGFPQGRVAYFYFSCFAGQILAPLPWPGPFFIC